MYETARAKVDLPKEHFRALVLRLPGDKDHAKVYEAVAKVEKRQAGGTPWAGYFHRGRGDGLCRGRGMRNSASIQCHYCGSLVISWRGVTRGGMRSKDLGDARSC